MNKGQARRGFSYVEAIVAVMLLGVGVAALSHGLASFARTENILRDSEKVNRLARQKLDELVATGEWQSTAEGTCESPFADFEWALDVTDTGVTDLRGLGLTVTDRTGKSFRTGWAETLLYAPANSGGTQ